jgi:hypothetical protein
MQLRDGSYICYGAKYIRFEVCMSDLRIVCVPRIRDCMIGLVFGSIWLCYLGFWKNLITGSSDTVSVIELVPHQFGYRFDM